MKYSTLTDVSTKTHFSFLREPLDIYNEYGEKLYQKSLDIIRLAQTKTGGIPASLPNTRYAGFIYPRDHAYALRALLKAKDFQHAQKAIDFILTCEVNAQGILSQRYDSDGKSASYKPPQIDGNAQSVLSLLNFINLLPRAQTKTITDKIIALLTGIEGETHHFPKGSLVYAVNGIIEFGPFETGYEIYTNAVCYKAYVEAGAYFKTKNAQKAQQYRLQAEKIHSGMLAYLYDPSKKSFMTCLRAEPDASVVTLANLKSILALTDFDVLPPRDPKIISTLTYHLAGTKNAQLGAFNRYHEAIGRHNFGNGPWILVMCRLGAYFQKAKQYKKAKACLSWVMQVALHNLDYPDGLPEHIATAQVFKQEYISFLHTQDITPRPAKEKEYKTIEKSKTLRTYGLAYAVNPLVWSHSAFILAWRS